MNELLLKMIVEDTAKRVALRRQELELSPEQAAEKAGISLQEWESVEQDGWLPADLIPPVLSAMDWHSMEDFLIAPTELHEQLLQRLNPNPYPEISALYGRAAAASLYQGLERMGAEIEEDIEKLEGQPDDTYLGEISSSHCDMWLPESHLRHYNLQFMQKLQAVYNHLCEQLESGTYRFPVSVAEEILIRAATEIGADLIRDMPDFYSFYDLGSRELQKSRGWYYEMFGDLDIEYIFAAHPYYSDTTYDFKNWFKEQFWQGYDEDDDLDLDDF